MRLARGLVLVVAGAAALALVREERAGVTLAGHTGRVLAVAAAAGSRYVPGSGDVATLASASDDGTIRLWEAVRANRQTSGRPTRILSGHLGPVNGVGFSPDGKTLASAGADGSVKLWDVATAGPTHTLRGHAGEVSSVAFSPDGKLLASAGADGTVRLWDTAAWTEKRTLRGHAAAAASAAFSDDGAILASGGADGIIKLWGVANGTEVSALRGHAGGVRALAFNPNGTAVASGGADGAVRLWEPSIAAELLTLRGHDGSVESVAFSPDGGLLASAGADGTVRFWTVHNGLPLRTLRGAAAEPVRAVAFFWRGNGVAFGGDDRMVSLWDVGLRKEVGTARGTVVSEGVLRPAEAVFIVDVESGRFQRIGPGCLGVWSADGRVLGFNSEAPDDRDSGYSLWNGSEVRRFGVASRAPLLMAMGPSFLVVELHGRFDEAGEFVSGDVPPRIVVHELSGGPKTLPLSARPRGRERWAEYSGPFAVSRRATRSR